VILDSRASRTYAPWLWVLAILFFGRVIAQVLVVFLNVTFLPPMQQWQSGLLPYPLLLASQSLILTLLCKIAADFTRGEGFFVHPSRRAGKYLNVLGLIYLAGMGVRYVYTMSVHPERRWILGTIPIVFHCVLATFILFVAAYHRRSGEEQPN